MAEQTLPYATLLLMNHTPFDVLLDDDLIEGAASRYEVLILPFSSTVTQSMAARLREYVAGGGRVIVNHPFRMDLPGAIRTRYDFTFEHRVRGNRADRIAIGEHRARVEGYAADLARHLSDRRGPVRSGKRVLTNTLEGGDVRYHFLINDDRTSGPRFGQYKVRFELGRPQMAKVTVVDPERPVLYDAIRRKRIETTKDGDGALNFEVGLRGAGGKLIAALPEEIDTVRFSDHTRSASLGEEVTARLVVLGKSGKVIRGSLPLRVNVTDATGRRVECSRYTTTRRTQDGVCEFRVHTGVNDLPGIWTIEARDLVADTTTTAKVTVTDPSATARKDFP
jgi:hypothetical protein